MEIQELLTLNWNYWFFQTIAMAITALLIPGLKITSIFGAFFTVVGLALVNAKVWDAALFFQIPNSFSMHALVLVLANGVIFWTLIKILPGIQVAGFLPAVAAPLVFAVCSIVISAYADQVDWIAVLEVVISALQEVKTYLYEAGGDISQGVPPAATPVP